MAAVEAATCSALSLAVGEPMAGTASRIRDWLLVEQPGPWGHHPLTSSGLPVEVGEALAARAGPLRLRVLLIQRRDRPRPTAVRRCFVAHTGLRERRLASFDMRDAADLLTLDLEGLVRARFRGFGQPRRGPLFLACTHGKRDQCCARRGGPLARALAGYRGPGEVWESTHVGGDRFAGNLVGFPHGVYFGRVGPAEAESVARTYAEGRLDLQHLRGRSCFSPAAQAAEWFLRAEEGIDGVDALVVVGHEVHGPRHRATFRMNGTAWTVEVEERRADPRPLTCKANRPGRPRQHDLVAIERTS